MGGIIPQSKPQAILLKSLCKRVYSHFPQPLLLLLIFIYMYKIVEVTGRKYGN